ncbi:alkylglycerol monooxygenase [Galendromus occidentalis]|uniref:Alkylglycerol monooxygenase n=1 Tax=Galendromus occidentalis TaxID=34638 RepID=A0AAJ6QM02_9ACAR|nr:alkylglycerol monooxygenase [Galendromus occidentalis]
MAVSQLIVDQLKKLGYLFYAAPPEDIFVEKLEDKKAFSVEVIPAFVILIVLEQLCNWWENKFSARFSANDAVTSAAQGMIMEIGGILTGGIGILCYVWVHENYRVAELPWDSWSTWLVTFLAVDFGYYVVHRAAHEVNIFWAAHQVHHSSEYYNLSTALRQSVLQEQLTFFFYLPLALFIPPQVYAIHKELNLLFQFWIHTQVIERIGPLEYILNTPSHHRVHHGLNRYCLDKNYAGVLIIWDRMFGTFIAEGEEVVYGVTKPVKTFDPFQTQFDYLKYIIKRFRRQKTWASRFGVLFKGPGWSPGKPRLGNVEDLEDVHAPTTVWNPEVASWIAFYGAFHFLVLAADYVAIANAKVVNGSFYDLALQALYVFFSLTVIGALFEGRERAKSLEVVRVVFYLAATQILPVFSFESRFGRSRGAFELSMLTIHALSLLFIVIQILKGRPLKKSNTLSVKQANYPGANGRINTCIPRETVDEEDPTEKATKTE